MGIPAMLRDECTSRNHEQRKSPLALVGSFGSAEDAYSQVGRCEMERVAAKAEEPHTVRKTLLVVGLSLILFCRNHRNESCLPS
jgi:hypothetical protein